MASPRTPPRSTGPEAAKAAAAIAKQYLATPHGHGSSTHASSGGYNDLYQRTVKPWLWADISKHKQTTFDGMIAYQLHMSLSTASRESVDPHRLFNQCLEKVLPICNDPDLLNHLRSYCEVEGAETARYEPFTNACNRALSLLEEVDVPHLGKGSPFKILFHRNDPNVLDGFHGTLNSKRKPDIVVTTLACARRIWGKGRNIQWKTAITHCHKKPKDLQWHDVLSAWEFKRTKKAISLPTRKYGPNLCRNIACVNDVGTMEPPTKPDVRSPQPRDIGDDDNESRPEEPPLVQLASYAAEMLCRAPAVNHCMNILVVDDVAWLWWYDRQSAIQCTGINFLDDLPRFLVLLLVFQRFSTMDSWGFNPELDPVVVKYHSGQLPLNQMVNLSQTPFEFDIPVEDDRIKVNLDPKKNEYSRHTLVGRGTRVFEGHSEKLSRDPDDPGVLMNERAKHAAIKIYWPDSSRPSEQTVVQKAREAAQRIDPDLLDNLPLIYGAYTLSKYETGHIRKFLQLWDRLDENQQPIYHSRTLNITISEWLSPLWQLPPPNFMLTWYEIVRCHFAMWIAGVKHCDPSEGNMLFRTKDNENHGVLNDWDLSEVDDLNDHMGLERTGTIPFMAMELLDSKFWLGGIRREYRHDLESFVWMLPWAALCYEGGSRKDPPKLISSWQTGNYEHCRQKKGDFVSKFNRVNINEVIPLQWRGFWPLIGRLVKRFLRRYRDRVDEEFEGNVLPPDKTPVQEYVDMLEFMRKLIRDPPVGPLDDVPFPDDYLSKIPQLPADTETLIRGRGRGAGRARGRGRAQVQVGRGDSRGPGTIQANLGSERSTSGSRRSARIKAEEEEKKRQEEKKRREAEERKRREAEEKKKGKKQ
ncbi:unnamed protein product [Somion occarium]|uniref:Fungal-type protein kinase domain-containing protein n=1 Tax=Somion occarium TaxID=3059160 RepID=A0ABP1E420_9APHY